MNASPPRPLPASRALGQRIRALRVRRVMSREALAAACGVSASTVGAYERGRREPTLAGLLRLAEVLRVTPDALLGTAPSELDPELDRLFGELRVARAEQVRMVQEFWEFLQRKEAAHPVDVA